MPRNFGSSTIGTSWPGVAVTGSAKAMPPQSAALIASADTVSLFIVSPPI